MSWLYIHCLVVHLKHIALSLICPLYLCHVFIVPVPHLFLTGHYCLNGTRVSVEYPCPAGTFNNITGLAADTDCFDCLGTVNTVTCA